MTAEKRSLGSAVTKIALLGLLSSLLWVSLGSCTPVTVVGGAGTSVDVDFDLAAQSVLRINFGGADAANVRLVHVPVAGGQLYLGKANVSGSAAAAAATGSVASFAAGRAAAAGGSAALSGGMLMDNERTRGFTPPPGARAKALLPSASVISFGPKNPALTVGTSTRLFWVENPPDILPQWVQVTATLRAASETAYLWVVDSNFSNLSATSNDNKITQTQIDTLDTSFSGTSPTAGNGIRALVSNIFSTENGGEPSGDGGIDSDQHIQILIYDIDGDYNAHQTSGIMGYFWAKDEYLDANTQTWQTPYRSNEAELFYLDAYFADKAPDMMVSTLAHEYQHMIHFNQKVLLRGIAGGSSTWFDEMCSMASEDFVAQTLGLPDDATPRSRVPQFNSFYYQSGVTDWLTGTDVLKSYASDYVFGAYLSRNFGGARLFRELVVSSATDQQAITNALQTLGTGTSFEAVFRSYSPTFVFGNPAPAGAYSFPALATTFQGVTYNLPAFALSDYGTLATFTPGQQTSLRPYGHSIHTASAWTNPAESTVVVVEKPLSSGVQMSLMFVKH